jgi:hypothetical protein
MSNKEVPSINVTTVHNIRKTEDKLPNYTSCSDVNSSLSKRTQTKPPTYKELNKAMFITMVGPGNQTGCIILCVANLAD